MPKEDYSTSHDGLVPTVLENLERELQVLQECAERLGQPARVIVDRTRTIRMLARKLLTPSPPETSGPNRRAYSSEQLEFIEEYYPTLVSGDIVLLPEVISTDSQSSGTVFDSAVVRKVTKMFPNGSAQYVEVWLVNPALFSKGSSQASSSPMQLCARGMQVVGRAVPNGR